MTDIGAFYTATIARQLPGINDAIINDCVVLDYLKSKGRVQYSKGGDGIDFRVRYAQSTIGGSTTDWGEGAAATTNPFKTLTVDYRQYAWRLMVSNFQKQRNVNAGSESKLFDMVMEQLNEVQQEAQNRIATHSYGDGSTESTGDDGTPMSGLEEIVDDDNTYAGQARSGNTWWQAQTEDQAAATFTSDSDSDGTADGLQTMQTLWRACSKGAGKGDGVSKDLAVKKDKPDMILTTSTGFGYFERCLQGQYMFTSDKADIEKELSFMGAPVKWDPFCTASRFYFLNSKYLKFDCCDSQMIKILQEQDIASPLAHIWVLGGQHQLYSTNPRYLGSLRLT